MPANHVNDKIYYDGLYQNSSNCQITEISIDKYKISW
jgi:hypothetical protein